MIYNKSTGKYLAGYPFWARDPLSRLFGMIGRRFVCGKFDALVFEKCGSVHSCFMGYPLDLVFLDAGDRVVSVVKRFPPWRVVFGGKGAVKVIELPPGAIEFSETVSGNILDLNSTLSADGIDKLHSGAILLSDKIE